MAHSLIAPTTGSAELNLDPSEYKLQFSAAGILDALGGANGIREELARYDLPMVTQYTVNMWRYRNSIPSDALATLLVVSDRMGVDLDLRKHIIAVVRRPLMTRLQERIETNKPPMFQ